MGRLRLSHRAGSIFFLSEPWAKTQAAAYAIFEGSGLEDTEAGIDLCLAPKVGSLQPSSPSTGGGPSGLALLDLSECVKLGIYLDTAKVCTPGSRQRRSLASLGCRPLSQLFRKSRPKAGGRGSGYAISTLGRVSRSRALFARVSSQASLWLGGLIVTGVSRYSWARVSLAEATSFHGSRVLIALPQGVFLGSQLRSGLAAAGSEPMRRPGTLFFVASLRPGDVVSSMVSYGVLSYWSRSPGSGSRLEYLSNCGRFGIFTLPSGLKKRVRTESTVRLGGLGAREHAAESLAKAGRSRLAGTGPRVRGIARNPVDHPNGGRSNSPSPSRSPWGWVAKHAR